MNHKDSIVCRSTLSRQKKVTSFIFLSSQHMSCEITHWRDVVFRLKTTKHGLITIPRLKENQRNRAIGQLETGVSISDVVRRFHVQRRIIRNLWQRFQQREVTTDLPRCGRPRITTRAEEHFMQVQHLRNRILTAQSTAENFQVSRNISRDLALDV
ncbi:transposable element tcb2 transposase [Plakobranchus ocellatus]|uniref:Transposable element tcb2 transposase n=1 Tax=Plakobranchus ocellatus TaxID=259542 RepID=A0AAV4A466_9GAST|nr:transposable element tcb2 transposase [Plakobranchus ocellatus]